MSTRKRHKRKNRIIRRPELGDFWFGGGSAVMRSQAADLFRWVFFNNHNWKRHPEPFAKTTRGAARRQQKLFRQAERTALLDPR